MNTIGYINRFEKGITTDFSGLSSQITDLSNTYPYHVTSSGINITNGNSAVARIKYSNNYLKSTDFASSSFTIYLKHAARFSNASPFNLLYPSVATVSSAVVLSGSDFSANFYSLLDPGSEVRYAFSGCTTTELNGTSLTGTVTAPYGTVTKTFTRANYAIFPTVVPQSLTISCGAPLPVTTYTVTVSGDNLFYIDGLRQLPTMTAGNVYLFDQSHSSNIGNTLVFGTTLDPPSYYTTGVFTNGTAGNAGAYTLLNYTSATLYRQGYYSRQTAGMGYGGYTATGTFSTVSTSSTHTVKFTANGTIKFYEDNPIVSILVVGGGGSGGTRVVLGNRDYGSAGGGGGGIAYHPNIDLSSGTTYNIIVDTGISSSFGDSLMIGSAGSQGGESSSVVPIRAGAGGTGSSTRLTGFASYNGGNGGFLGTGGEITNGGSSTTIQNEYYSGGGTTGKAYHLTSVGVQSYSDLAIYGTGGNGHNAARSGPVILNGNAGKNGVVIITFNPYMPYISPSFTYTGTFLYSENVNGYRVLTLTGSGSLTINSSYLMIYCYVVGAGGGGGNGKSNQNNQSVAGNGGNGGVVNTGSFVQHYGSYNYTVVVGDGGVASAGGSSSLSGSNLTTVTSNGGYVGLNGRLSTQANLEQSTQTNGAKGGTGGNSGGGVAGANGTISFTPTGISYGGAGGGGSRAAAGGNGGTIGGGNGKGYISTDPGANDGDPGNDYGGGGGGGAGNGSVYGGIGGNGYKGVVFLYWSY